MGRAFYDGLRQALYRWIRVYDDLDARERIEQMTEWAEGEDDPESYEIPKLEQTGSAAVLGGQATFRHCPALGLVPNSQCALVPEEIAEAMSENESADFETLKRMLPQATEFVFTKPMRS
jgi:hypothetical protein